ncbi:Response regulator rcp1 [Gemmata sp. SH-PL17]|uniref:response regulator n=1 Tax=Gemmata sp. SH-PL17 TaxID=1630693 RepID=UPI0004B57B1A|nr:response regulator [Gemmata sp. SH-PL17]AMV28542.1 Response regulator rcp1 [Gemmata sp. SH-PL17]
MSDHTNRTLLVLHAEDNTDHAELVRRCLQRHPVVKSLVLVEDGEAVLDYVFRRGAFATAVRPDVILLDLRLPKADGLEVLRSLKTHPDTAHIPVVILSTSSRDADVRGAYDLHANSYLTKPIELTALDQLLADFVVYWGQRNHPPAHERRAAP